MWLLLVLNFCNRCKVSSRISSLKLKSRFENGSSKSNRSGFAIIALAGIVVNNSIILVATIERRMKEIEIDRNLLENAVVRGAMDRLRPMLLTSLTTIGGLSALMFEKSLQAQFLIPMATTITFGLAVTSTLVLFVVPAMIGVTNDIKNLVKWVAGFFGLGASDRGRILQMDD